MTTASRSSPSNINTPSMINEVRPPSFEKIDAALLGVAEALPRLPEWHEAVCKLVPATRDETRLAVYQAVRA
ncbi:MAG TPA: hypothetical protein VFW94_00585 [Candidatus Acidoferrales bacterium]|nr:hypothetical protein [Candidatus Acidoferrales bacterium]